ncbi:2-oxopent-4-enoate hydratase [Fictibacillus macauensis ZFHKF-1]|uniref:2-oxopent-4-enoate hydratase n=1 Tax=Fictibacillus macauensis ZFHKF-1 TaxID=1196324 RepID=I8UGY8_9BACL|nr:fumarylacetoacetate hydrolase family protein [Fictibacillus macauensis]EIT86165.1 2-oxopent-4-enoate hydratase [Fictibacillus macauensis ZFHKF-1]
MEWSDVADALWEAERRGNPISPLTQQLQEMSVEDAYYVQQLVAQKKQGLGQRMIGRKVGLTSVAMQHMLGVNEPDYGLLFDAMVIRNGGSVSLDALIAPKIEAEIGFVLKEPLAHRNVTFTDVLQATDYVVPTLEIIDSRIENWDITLADTVADNGSSALVVLGEQKTSIAGIDFRSSPMILSRNEKMIATGAGAAALGHPAQAIAWLANTLYERGMPLQAGELILPGALAAAETVLAGDQFTAQFGVLGDVCVSFV